MVSNNVDSVLDEGLSNAIKKEVACFKENYTWLKENMPRRFFEQISKETITLIVHNLVSFHLQSYFSQIHLPTGSIVLSIDSPDADLKVLSFFSFHVIKIDRDFL